MRQREGGAVEDAAGQVTAGAAVMAASHTLRLTLVQAMSKRRMRVISASVQGKSARGKTQAPLHHKTANSETTALP